MTQYFKKKTLFIAVLTLLAVLSVIFYIYPAAQNNIDTTWIERCNDPKLHGELTCWVDGIKSMIQRDGMKVTFAVISNRLMNEPSFKSSCNQILHDIGHWTYHQAVHNNLKFVVPPHITVCASAFDRAFVHELTAATGDFAKAVAFCTNSQLASESPEATDSCYHGIGHGAFGFYGSKMGAKNQQTAIARALEECAKIARTPLGLDYCTGGVFSEVIKFYQTDQYQYGMMLDKKDPFAFCRERADAYKKMCYATAKPLLLWLANGDFSKAASFIETIVEDEYATVAIDALANSVTMQNITKGTSIVDYDGDIFACRKLQKRLHAPCIQGLAIELLTHGSPADAIDFCQLSILAEGERDACFNRIIPHFSEWTPRDQIRQICLSLEEKYREECNR